MADSQAKDLDADAIVELIRECNEARCDYSAEAERRGWGAWHGGRPGYTEADDEPPRGHWANVTDLADRLGVPKKVLRAKLQRLIDQGRITGCACGCRGDLEVVPAEDELKGKLVLAHPSRAAQADQLAAAEKIERVMLREHLPTTHLYILDLDKLAALPEAPIRDS